MNEKIINLPKFGMGAEVRSASFDEAENTIEVIWTTGAPVSAPIERDQPHCAQRRQSC
ncbi:hypothetical protein [Shinella zoogloeoides]